jgi:hypothetical protein
VNPCRLVPEIKSHSLKMLQNVHYADLISGTAPLWGSLEASKRTITSALTQRTSRNISAHLPSRSNRQGAPRTRG